MKTCYQLQNGANPMLRLTGEMISKNNALHMAIMHYDGDVRIIDMILDHIGREGINETIFNHYGKQVTPLDMMLNHPMLHLFGKLIGRVITKMTVCLEHSSVLILFVAKCKCVCNDLSITCVQ